MVDLEHLVGAVGHASSVVESENTAVSMGSGALPVLATPAVVALIEQAAMTALQPYLPLGMTTVGTGITLRHVAATPLGHNIQAEAALVQVMGRKLVFRVSVFDERERVADGTHERFMVDAERFMSKVGAKRPKGT